jgi:hypothetical protein
MFLHVGLSQTQVGLLVRWFVSVLFTDAVPSVFRSVELKEEWAEPQSDCRNKHAT